MGRAGLALCNGLGCGTPTPHFSPSSRAHNFVAPRKRVATAQLAAPMRLLASMRLARSQACSGTVIRQGQSLLLHRSLFGRETCKQTGRQPQHRCLAQAADQSSSAGGAATPVIERPAETSASNEGTPGASSSKAGGYPFAEIEPKWQR